jgi:hypothetical protein
MPKPAALTEKERTLDPVVVSDTCWLYGEIDGLTVVQEDRDADGTLNQTLMVTIPWDKVARARYRRPMK